ncbi:MAG: hypothetical protein Q9160_006107 [Pyrenula sp. 1 TL-2023]
MAVTRRSLYTRARPLGFRPWSGNFERQEFVFECSNGMCQFPFLSRIELGDGSWSDWKGENAREVAEQGFVTFDEYYKNGYKFPETYKDAEADVQSDSTKATSAPELNGRQLHLPQDQGLDKPSMLRREAASPICMLTQSFSNGLDDPSSFSPTLTDLNSEHSAAVEYHPPIGYRTDGDRYQINQPPPRVVRQSGAGQSTSTSDLAPGFYGDNDFKTLPLAALNRNAHSGQTSFPETSRRDPYYQAMLDPYFKKLNATNAAPGSHLPTAHEGTEFHFDMDDFERTPSFGLPAGLAEYTSSNNLPVSGESSSSASVWPSTPNSNFEIDPNFDANMYLGVDSFANPGEESFESSEANGLSM